MVKDSVIAAGVVVPVRAGDVVGDVLVVLEQVLIPEFVTLLCLE